MHFIFVWIFSKQANWVAKGRAVGSTDHGMKDVTNGAQQTGHKYSSAACRRFYTQPQDTFETESSHQSGLALSLLSHLSEMHVVSSGFW